MTNRYTAAVIVVCLAVTGWLAADEQKEKDKPRDARATAAAYLDAALNGRVEEATAMGEPGQAPSRPGSVKDFAELKIKKLGLKSVHADQTGALAVTDAVKADHDRDGPLVLTLVKKEGRWLVRDIDVETEESAKDEMKRFLDKHPEAKPVPEKK